MTGHSAPEASGPSSGPEGKEAALSRRRLRAARTPQPEQPLEGMVLMPVPLESLGTSPANAGHASAHVDDGPEPGSWDAHAILDFARKYALFMVVAALLGGLVAFLWTLTQTKQYSAQASGFVVTGESESLAGGTAGDMFAKSRVVSYQALATSREVAERAAKALGRPDEAGGLASRISVSVPTDSVLIRITAVERTPKDAQNLADTWVKALADQIQAVENSTQQEGRNAVISLQPVSAAVLPTSPSYPVVRTAVLLGTFIGLVLGLVGSLWKNRFDRTIRGRDIIERRLGIPVLGVIPAQQKDFGVRDLIDQEAGDAKELYPIREALRELRTNIKYVTVDRAPRVLMLSSPSPGDGKSTTALALAFALESGGKRVVVVDCDLRKPTVVEKVGLPSGAGLTDVLTGDATVEDVLQQYRPDRELWILGAGNIPPNPTEILESEAFEKVLEQLAQDFTVILDTPPLLSVIDAAALGDRADGMVLVVTAGKTKIDELEQAARSVRQAGGHVLGVVINRVGNRGSDSRYYGYYQREYYYSQGQKKRKS